MAKVIDKFVGQYRFLSNFYPAPVEFRGRWFPTIEHAFQAAKTNKRSEIMAIQNAKTAGQAKKLGRAATLRGGWNGQRVEIMLGLLRLKFKDPWLLDMLLVTGEAELIEGNNWGDLFWGVCDGRGENMLGKLLMQVRKELRAATPLKGRLQGIQGCSG